MKVYVTILAVASKDLEKNISQSNQCLSRGSNQAPAQIKSETLLESNFSLESLISLWLINLLDRQARRTLT